MIRILGMHAFVEIFAICDIITIETMFGTDNQEVIIAFFTFSYTETQIAVTIVDGKIRECAIFAF